MQKYLMQSFYLWLFFSGTMSALYLTAKVSSQILYWICLLFTLVWFLHWIGVVTKRFFNAFLIIEHILMIWRREYSLKSYTLYFYCKTKMWCSNIFQHKAKLKLCNQIGWKLLSNKCYCIYPDKFIWFVLGSFLENSVNIFSYFDLKHGLP